MDPNSQTDGIPAGAFGEWLAGFRASLLGNRGSDVPCGECRGCCISGYSVQIRPHDEQARALIPAKLLVSAPGFARNELTMAARPDGTCPMLHNNECTIYRNRPQTCRDYDCRVFAAAGLAAGGSDKAVINRRVCEWRFSYPTQSDRAAHAAVKAAATFIATKRSSFPGQRAPAGPTGIAVLACKTYAVFLAPDIQQRPDEEVARRILAASRKFHHI
ncbi:MAG: YkgJ family cysteine cluster protein [Proteobacteria bacterium]|nr:YkgJ family cysteine cluster protein [Pseudomonadota bacterium]